MTGDGSLSWNRSEKFQENQVNFNIKLYDTKQDTEPSLVICHIYQDDDYLVYDYRQNIDANMKIMDSYRADKETRNEILDILLDFENRNPTKWNRTKKSMENEWFWHNRSYDFYYERERTKDVDLNNNDEYEYPRLTPFF